MNQKEGEVLDNPADNSLFKLSDTGKLFQIWKLKIPILSTFFFTLRLEGVNIALQIGLCYCLVAHDTVSVLYKNL